MSQKVIIKKGELEGSIIEERMGKFKVAYKKPEKKSGMKREKTSWFENSELKRIW